MPKPLATPKPESAEFTLQAKIIFKARCAVLAGRHEVAIALFEIIAEHFDWGFDETKLDADGEGVADVANGRSEPQHNESGYGRGAVKGRGSVKT